MADEKESNKGRKKKGSINALTEQTQIPGTEPPGRDKELDELGKLAAELTDANRETREAMTETRDQLREMMIAKGLTEYHLTRLAKPRWVRIKKTPDKLTIELDKDSTGDDDDESGAGGVDISED